MINKGKTQVQILPQIVSQMNKAPTGIGNWLYQSYITYFHIQIS